MKSKKHNLVYQITNLINGKVYIGRHITDNVDDGYMGSGDQIQKAIKKYGRENFKKEILFDFNNPEEMINKENELLTEDFVNRNDVYNLVIGGSSGMIGKTHNNETREILRNVNTGIVSVKDKFGNNFKVSKDDPRYLSGELKHNTSGTICVKDSEGNKFRVTIDDPRWISGELVGASQGIKRPVETTNNHICFMKNYWSNRIHTDEALQKMKDANKGKVTVRDVDGNVFRVSNTDERYITGELIVACKGNVWINNKDLQKCKFINIEKIQKFLDEGWNLGLVYFNRKILITIKNEKLQKTKRVLEDNLQEFLNNGWVRGRIKIPDVGNKIKAGKSSGKWMINPTTKETKIIHLKSIDLYLINGWILGRIIHN